MELSIFNQTFEDLIFINKENPDFTIGDIIVYNISPFTVNELKEGVKYQDGKFSEFFEKDYVDFNTVIQYY